MTTLTLVLLVAAIISVVAAEFLNGLTDAANAISTVVSTRALSLRAAIIMAAVCNLVGAFLGKRVAETIGKGFIDMSVIDLPTIIGAMSAIVIWSALTYKYGLPTSETHALVAGLTGAGFATGGMNALVGYGWAKVGWGLLTSTAFGFGASFLFTIIVRFVSAPFAFTPSKQLFRRMQIVSAGAMAAMHGLGDGQKFMGVIAMSLKVSHASMDFSIPAWVVVLCAATMCIGTSFGGWRIIRTMGVDLVPLTPRQAFACETAAAALIYKAADFGLPMSTTHTIGMAIAAAGAADDIKKVNKKKIMEIVAAWILTFPASALLGFLVTGALRIMMHVF